MLRSQPEYRVMIALDVERSAGRGNVALLKFRESLFAAVRDACAASDIPWDACHRADLGDGMLLVGPPDMPKSRFIYPFATDLAERLRAHNRTAGPTVRIRVRAALHAGDIHVEDGTIAGSPLEFLARMLDAPPIKQGLAAAPQSTTVGLIVSPHIYDEVVRHGYPGINPDMFRRVEFTVKETTATAWVRLPADVPVESTPEPTSAARYVQNNRATGGTVFAVQDGSQNVHVRES